MQYPKISIVTPSYNQANYLEETIISVLNQNYSNLEYIIIDGGSTDGSVNIIKKYEKQLFYWISEPDEGQYHAIKKGFDKSTGEIMTYINSDDVLINGSLNTIADIFSHYQQIEWITGIPNFIDERGNMAWVGELKRWNKYNYIGFDFEYIQQEGTFWNRSLWERAGCHISLNYKLASDLELWSRFFISGDLYTIPVLLGSFRIRRENQRSLEGLNDYLEESKSILRKMPQERNDQKNIKLTKSRIFSILKRKYFRIFYRILGFEELENKFNNFPPILRYDRKLQRFTMNKML